MPKRWILGNRLLRALFWGSLMLITILSLMPLSGGEMLFPLQDKVFHSGAYLYFYSVGWIAYAPEAKHRIWNARLFIGLIGYGIAIELLQGATGFRERDPFDLMANVIGLCLGLGVVVLYSWGCRQNNRKP